MKGDEIIGCSYEYELQKVKTIETYSIEKILKSRTRKSKRQLLVPCLGSDFDSWIAAEDVQNALWFLCGIHVQCLWPPLRWFE